MRALVTALLCAAAVVAADVVFRVSLLDQLRPVILSPPDQAAVDPPVLVHWEGPRHMRALLGLIGEEQQDLGVRESPFEIPAEILTREGGYELELQSPRFAGWIQARRRFQVHARPGQSPGAGNDEAAPAEEIRDLFVRALAAARSSRDTARARTKFLRDENAALREQGQRLTTQLEVLYEAQEQDVEEIAELEQRLAQFSEANRSLAEENALMRQRLSAVIPCTVWGYFSYPRPNTIPVTRRIVTVSDTRGQVFRRQGECERLRRRDPTAEASCFCVGNSWGALG
jgi:hypothetical protein